MKKTLLLILASVFILMSCEKNTEKGVAIDTYPLYYSATEYDGDLKKGGTGMSAATIAFTELDRVIIDITTDASISSVDVYSSATNVGATVSITGGTGQLDASLAAMEIASAGSNNYIGFHYEWDGNKANEAAYIRNLSPWDLDVPSGVVENDTEHDIAWEIITANATVDDVSMSLKVGAAGTAVVTTGLDLEDDLQIVGSDYSYGDTIYIVGTATAGTLTAVVSDKIVIGKYSFKTTTTIDLTSADVDPYDLDELEFATAGQLGFTNVVGSSIGFTGNGAEFVVSDDATYDENNVVTIMADFAAGAKVTAVSDAAVGDIFIFKTTNDTYGMMKVTGRVESFDGSEDALTIEIMTL
ncbi:MAG: hypothetical protein V2I37_14465 [Marinilabiliaceae bacterium]|jgi:hypothetical protein|nr:hypothetical protein [Marinilabiliaceae bacterium]